MNKHVTPRDDERDYVMDAAFALTDPFAGLREDRIRFLTDALKRDPDREYRREVTREYLNLFDPEQEPDF